ncbi:MAG: tyrosine-type recombinase/integrase [Chloroflexota bacterium]
MTRRRGQQVALETETTPPAGAEPAALVTSRRPDQPPAAVYLARLAPGSRRTVGQVLEAVARTLSAGQVGAAELDWAQLRHQHTAAIRAALAEKYAPATVNKALAALRGTLREAWRLGQMSAEDYRRAADLPGVKGSTLPAGRALDSGELRALFAVCGDDPTPAGARDAALLAVLYGGGLRRAEAIALDLGDYVPATAELHVRAGKSHKERLAYVPDGTARALAAWVARRGPWEGPLFWPIDKAGNMTARRMTAQAIFYTLRKRAAQAGVGAFSPHDLRRSFISDLLDAGADIATVQHLAGHANVTTTARYDRRGKLAKQQAAGLLDVPYASPI